MINKVFHDLLFGRITFVVKDGFCDMFLSICRREGVTLSDVDSRDNSLICSVMQKDYAKTIEAAGKSGMEITVLKRWGLPHLYYRYRKRLGVPVGLLLFTIIIRILTLTVWSIEITGNEKITDERLYEILENNGVSKGVFADSIQNADIEYVLYNELEELLWVKVYVTGSRVFIDIRERNTEQESDDINMYSNIVAAKDGEIVRADVFSGEGKIYPGTAVVKGDMLVNGVITYSDGGVKFVRSDADVFARTRNAVSTSAALTITAKKTVNYTTAASLYFFDVIVPFCRGDKENHFTTDCRFFRSGDIVFPLGVIRDTYFSFETTQIELSSSAAALLAFSDFSKASFELYRNSEVLERKISFDFSSQISVEGKYLCIENIALEKSFTVNEEK